MPIKFKQVSLSGQMIFDTVSISPQYAITPNSISINEGDTVTFDIETSNVPDGTTLYWTASGTCSAPDFTDAQMSGSFVVTSDAGSVVRTLTNDGALEGTESLFLNVRTGSIAGPVVVSSAMVIIGDTSFTVTDPVFNYNALLLNGDGPNTSQNNTAIDSSTNNYTLTRMGSTTQGSFSPFSETGWSGYFINTDSLYHTGGNTAFAFGTGDFTIEMWINPSTNSAVNYLMDFRTANGSATPVWVTSSGKINYYAVGGGSIAITGVQTLVVGSWYHVAIVRSSGVTKQYINGVQDGSSYTDANNYIVGATNAPSIGSSKNIATTSGWQGYLSNVRIVKGTAVYTSSFAVPTAPLTAISGTSLLSLQSNMFVDMSSNAFVISVTGTPSVQSSSPFVPDDAYSPSVNGGSIYTSVKTDGYTVPAAAPIITYTGAFTMEAWVYPTNIAITQWGIIDARQNGASATSYIFSLANGTTAGYLVNLYNGANHLSTARVPLNQWSHVAAVKNGTTVTYYINGVADVSTWTLAGSLVGGATSNPLYLFNTKDNGIGAYGNFGYTSDLRVVNGTAVYTGNFAPPTAPLTAVTNTALLVSCKNAGIVDATSQNDVLTVGSAQASTTVAKYGTASMKFNGSTDSLTIPTNPKFAFGAGDFTIEMWVYTGATGVEQTLYDARTANGVYATLNITSSNTIGFYVSSAYRVTGATTLSINTWYHVAVSKSSGSTKVFLNGVQEGSTYTDANVYLNGIDRPSIGVSGIAASNYFNGYIDDLRVTKGVGRYTANFTPPAAALPTE